MEPATCAGALARAPALPLVQYGVATYDLLPYILLPKVGSSSEVHAVFEHVLVPPSRGKGIGGT